MSYMITAECINCSACEMECPVRAISPGSSQYLIDPSVCIECEGYYPVARCKWACPVDACVPERALYLQKSAAMINKGAAPVILSLANPAGSTMAVGG
jgi:ferredoxin